MTTRLVHTDRIIISKCKAILEDFYGPQFKGLILFGSTARRQASPSSDIDLLVLLSGSFDFFVELRRIIELLYPIQLKSRRLISAKPTPVNEFETGSIQLYRNAKKEGIQV